MLDVPARVAHGASFGHLLLARPMLLGSTLLGSTAPTRTQPRCLSTSWQHLSTGVAAWRLRFFCLATTQFVEQRNGLQSFLDVRPFVRASTLPKQPSQKGSVESFLDVVERHGPAAPLAIICAVRRQMSCPSAGLATRGLAGRVYLFLSGRRGGLRRARQDEGRRLSTSRNMESVAGVLRFCARPPPA